MVNDGVWLFFYSLSLCRHSNFNEKIQFELQRKKSHSNVFRLQHIIYLEHYLSFNFKWGTVFYRALRRAFTMNGDDFFFSLFFLYSFSLVFFIGEAILFVVSLFLIEQQRHHLFGCLFICSLHFLFLANNGQNNEGLGKIVAK